MGKCLILDSTCFDSFSPSALALTATEPGSASSSAEVRTNIKYEGLCDRYIFQAIAIESSGVLERDPNAFISRLCHLTTSISGERREAELLRQRLSLATTPEHIGRLARMSVLDTEVDSSNPGSSMLFP